MLNFKRVFSKLCYGILLLYGEEYQVPAFRETGSTFQVAIIDVALTKAEPDVIDVL